MKRVVVAAVVLALLGPAASGARWDIKSKEAGRLIELRGVVLLSPSGRNGLGGSDWDLLVPSKSTKIELRAGRRTGWYLCYDPSGKDPTVTLNTEKQEWQVEKVKGGYVLRPAEGKYKGWYLSAGAAVTRPKEVIGHEAVLTTDAKKAVAFSIREIAG